MQTLHLGPIPARALGLAHELGGEAYVVGGYVRDLLLGRPSKDIDVVTIGVDPASLLLRLSAEMGWAPPVIFERFGTAHVRGDDGLIVEAVRARRESYDPNSRKPNVAAGTLYDDVWRRDFTINALCVGRAGTIIDLTGMGLNDLRAGVLRTPMDPRETFSEDPLRMVRAARFVSKLDVMPAAGIVEAMRQVACRLSVVSVERVTEELRQLLVTAHPSRGLELLRAGGLLDVIIPELLPMVGCTQDTRHHCYDVWDHTMHALDAAVPDLMTRLAVLFHDVGKPTCKPDGGLELIHCSDTGELTTLADVPGRISFIGHEIAGAEIADGVLKRLRFSDEERQVAVQLVGLHMRPMWYGRDRLGPTGLRRLVRDAGELRGAMLAVARADVAASGNPDSAFLDELEARLAEVDATGAIAAKRRALTGEMVMAWQGRGPGPWVGEVMRAYDEAVLAGGVSPDDLKAAEEWLVTADGLGGQP